MIRKLTVGLFILVLLITIIPSITVGAQSGPRVIDTSVEIDFPSLLQFNLITESQVNIKDIRLKYTVERISYATVISEVFLQFTPNKNVTVSWIWDMKRTGGLPPGTEIEYWWLITDDNNLTYETAPTTISFDDYRYAWNNINSGEISLYWYEGDSGFAEELLYAAQQALTWLELNTGAKLLRAVKLYIYDPRDLLGAMIYPQEWTGGVAFTRYGTIAIGISPGNIAWGKRAIAHELTHLVIHQLTFNAYDGLPTWLDEGLAANTEGELNPGYARSLNEAIKTRELIPIRSLASPFSSETNLALLSYAQSYSIVKFMIDEYGQNSILELLNTFQQGTSYDEALLEVYGFDMGELERQWLSSLEELPTFQRYQTIVLIAVASIVGLALLLYLESLIIKRRRKR